MFGPVVPPENAPEEITKAVASLPPEQMFELMKQMKLFIMHQPEEARQLLLHNPQLPYALLQAQVVMRIVDPHQAHDFLHKTRVSVPNFNDVDNIHPVDVMSHQDVYQTEFSARQSEHLNEPHYEYRQCNFNPLAPYIPRTDMNPIKANHSAHRNLTRDLSQDVNYQLQHQPVEDIRPLHAPQDPRTIQDMKLLNVSQNRPSSVNFARHSQSLPLKPITDTHRDNQNISLIEAPLQTFTKHFEAVPKIDVFETVPKNIIPSTNSDIRVDSRLSNSYIQPTMVNEGLRCDAPHDPRKVYTHCEQPGSISTGLELRHPNINLKTQHTVTLSDLNRDPSNSDKSTSISSITQEEKTSLILQVLALTDEQIAQLTVEQRQSIILLKEQIAKQTGAAIQSRN